jgi:hypothetical protein
VRARPLARVLLLELESGKCMQLARWNSAPTSPAAPAATHTCSH